MNFVVRVVLSFLNSVLTKKLEMDSSFFRIFYFNFFLKNSNLTGRFSQKSASFRTVFQSMGLTGEAWHVLIVFSFALISYCHM
jgi:hypothetical protein